MKNIKKYLTTLVALSFVLLFAAGCAGTGNKTTESSLSETESSSSETISSSSETESSSSELKIKTFKNGNRYYDSMDYTFIPDDEIIGTWQSVCYVDKIEDFEAGEVMPQDKPFWQSCIFKDSGDFSYKFSDGTDLTAKWTKGYVLFSSGLINGVIPAYTLKQIDGKSYLFVEWKSGDYMRDGKIQVYYVFEKISD